MTPNDVGTAFLVGVGVFLLAGAAYSSHRVKMIDRAIERSEAEAPPAE